MITLPSNIQRQRKNVKLCMVGIQKQNVNIKNFNKNKSLPCLHCSNKFPWDKTRIDKCLVPFLSTLSWFYWQVMHFCKSFWATLIDTCFKPLQTFSFVFAYWHVF